MYIQEEGVQREQTAPPDYRGHTYKMPEKAPERGEFSTEESGATPDLPAEENVVGEQEPPKEKSTPVGAFGGGCEGVGGKKGGKRGDFLGNFGLSGLFSRVPFLSAFAPPPRGCDTGARKHSELWDLALLAVIALSLLGGRDDDVLPLLLLLLLWD